jgi:hypothetical protein
VNFVKGASSQLSKVDGTSEPSHFTRNADAVLRVTDAEIYAIDVPFPALEDIRAGVVADPPRAKAATAVPAVK